MFSMPVHTVRIARMSHGRLLKTSKWRTAAWKNEGGFARMTEIKVSGV
jgi:hypothetical protein